MRRMKASTFLQWREELNEVTRFLERPSSGRLVKARASEVLLKGGIPGGPRRATRHHFFYRSRADLDRCEVGDL